MSIVILTNMKCNHCNVNHVKNPDCLSDYYPTKKYGYVLQSYCPECGRMLPLIEEKPENYISNNNKKRLLNRIALEYNYRFKELMKNIFYKHKDINVKDDFIRIVAKETNLPVDKIIIFCS